MSKSQQSTRTTPAAALPRQILIVSAPSGAGKTSLTRALTKRRADVGLAVSHTTRDRRAGEQDGVHYHFVSRAEFVRLIEANRFIEYATVFDHYYGTSVTVVENLMASGRHAILEIDWQGARKLRAKFPHAKSVFVMPPSLQVLEQRLRQRQRDNPATIAKRMQAAVSEMAHQHEYQHALVNDDFTRSVDQLEHILLDQ